jgi:hypothetical protein
MSEQRNSYKGRPPRPWLRLEFLARDGTRLRLDLLADTGSPYGLIVGRQVFNRLLLSDTNAINTNFGPMLGGWVRLHTTELGLVEFVQAYASDSVADAVAHDHPDYQGLVGLPVLRLAEFGGNADEFWIRTP